MPNPDLLRVTVEPLEDGRLIRAVGEVDLSTAAALGRELAAARVEADTVLLDLSEVTFIDSSGLHLLLEASHSSAVTDWSLFVVPSEAVRRLVELSGTADRLTLVDPTREPIPAEEIILIVNAGLSRRVNGARP
jgi:anti-sigma B factor antagonist